MANVHDPTLHYDWAIPDVGGDIGSWDGILNTMFGEDTAVDPVPVLGMDAVIGLIEADIDTLKTDLDSLLGRITTLEANAVTSMGARLDMSGTQAIPQDVSTKLTFGNVVFDEGGVTTDTTRITVPDSGAGAWQIRASVTGDRYAPNSSGDDDGRFWELIIWKNGITGTELARKRVPYINDGVHSSDSSTITVGISILDSEAVEGDYYEAFVEQGAETGGDPGSSTVAVGTGTFIEGVRVFHENARSFVRSVAYTQDNTASTTHNVTLPDLEIEVDDIVLIFYVHRGTGAITTPTGYTAIDPNDDGTMSGSIFWRRATQGESAQGVIAIEKVGTNSMAALAAVVRGISTTQAPEGESNDGDGDPPSITPSWGATRTVFIAVSAPGEEETVTDAPTGYDATLPAGISGSGSEVGIDGAFRLGKQTTEDPGAFTYETAVDGICWTLALEVA
jgi:hypothetical protein